MKTERRKTDRKPSGALKPFDSPRLWPSRSRIPGHRDPIVRALGLIPSTILAASVSMFVGVVGVSLLRMLSVVPPTLGLLLVVLVSLVAGLSVVAFLAIDFERREAALRQDLESQIRARESAFFERLDDRVSRVLRGNAE